MLTFHLPQGWTLRKVAGALAREWLPPFRAEHPARGARWTVQSVVDAPAKGSAQLWEPGISTRAYEERLDRPDVGWAIRASAGRGKGTILVRMAMRQDQPDIFEVTCVQPEFPAAVFDSEKVDEFTGGQGAGMEPFLAALLEHNGFTPAAV